MGNVNERRHRLVTAARVAGQPRIAAKAVAQVAQTPVTVCSAHTEIPALGRARSKEQLLTVSDASDGGETERAVVGGDLNTASRRAVTDLVARFGERGFRHASAAATRTLRRVGRDFTLDHVFIRGLSVTGAGVVRRIDVSDHDPVWVDLEGGMT